MNAKKAKAIRQAIRLAMKIPRLSAEYVTRVSKTTQRTIEEDTNEISGAKGRDRTFRIEQLTIMRDAKSSRSLYQRTKGIASNRGFKNNSWGSTGELWSPTPGFYPDSRYMECNPGVSNPPDNGAAVYDRIESEPGSEQAQTG